MLLFAREMNGATVEATDGKLGKLVDFLFDDRNWNIKSLVLDAGTWLNSRRVTMPPDLVRHRDWADHRLTVTTLTREQVVNSPDVETNVPVGDLTRLEAATIIDWGLHWSNILDHPWQVSDDPHIRSTEEMARYHFRETDGCVGHIVDFLIDDEAWKIRFIEADTRNWLPGKHVLVAPGRIESIDGENRVVKIGMTRRAFRHLLDYHPAMEQTGEYETLTNVKL
jgi:uncharacterized protein YrrD